MKNYLLAGTSALALALTAGAANAQSAPGKFDIKLSGDAYVEGGYVNQTQDSIGGVTTAGGVDFTDRFRLVVNPVATADNGLTYGAVARLRANSATGTIDGDKAYAYVAGAFGEIRGGAQYGAGDATSAGGLAVTHPMDWQLAGLYDQWRAYVPTTNGATAATAVPLGYTTGGSSSLPGTTTGFAWGQYNLGQVGAEGVQLLDAHNIDTKIVYYTPRVLGSTPTTGLQGGFTYAPRNGGTSDGISVNTDVNRSLFTAGGATSLQRTYFDDTYEAIANYTDTLNGLLVSASAGYAGGSAHNDGTGAVGNYHDLQSVQFGAQVGYAGFAVGGGYVYGGDSGYTTAPYVSTTGTTKSVTAAGNVATQLKDQYAWNVGGQYTYGPWVVGVKFLEEVDAGNLAYSGSRTLDAVTTGTMYTVAPGLRVGGEYTHFEATSNIPTTVESSSVSNDSGDVVLLRTIVNW